ncbi:MAG: UDP-N-acetylmuramoyl-L-alanyl-D-glutamate--2,6-diaminopimelate ligase [Patescibacteria group bacterium]
MWQQLKNIYHLAWAIVANIAYGFPARELYCIGITGTDGKTTTALLIDKILSDAGKKTVVITTLGATIAGKPFETGLHVTTPSSIGIQRFLRAAVKAGCTHAVIEASSHALDQNRVRGIRFNVALLTNITHEHLDYHKTMARYTAAKLKLLRNAKTVIVNRDDSSYADVKMKLRNKKHLTYSLRNLEANFTLNAFPITTQLTGDFNLQNSLAAAATAVQAGIGKDAILKSIASFRRPKGRQDVVYDGLFRIVIDFAVTPNAFKQVLPEVRKDTSGRIIHVFGLSGKRDASKRPVMGGIAASFADVIILTADDPRNEAVEKIDQQIKKGIQNFTEQDAAHYHPLPGARKQLFEISDRTAAINFAVGLAEPGDTVLLTGKAHEKSLAMKGGEMPWDEYKAVKEALAKREASE